MVPGSLLLVPSKIAKRVTVETTVTTGIKDKNVLNPH